MRVDPGHGPPSAVPGQRPVEGDRQCTRPAGTATTPPSRTGSEGHPCSVMRRSGVQLPKAAPRALGLVSVAFPPRCHLHRSVRSPTVPPWCRDMCAWRLGGRPVRGRVGSDMSDRTVAVRRTIQFSVSSRSPVQLGASGLAVLLMDTVTGKWSDYSICSGSVRT
jgi:hypothetical protein